MPISDLFYDKYGTRIAVADEGNESLQRFAYDGCRAMLADSAWEILPGPVERVAVGSYDGERIVAYLWPIARVKDPRTPVEYGVRVRDERTDASRINIKPSLVMAQDSRDMLRDAYAAGDTYLADAEVVGRWGGAGVWMGLSDEDIARIIDDAWEGLDQAFQPVIEAGLSQLAEQQRVANRPYADGGDPR